MLSSNVYQIEINPEQPEWRVIQSLVQLGFQKALWSNDVKTDFIEVYIPLSKFSNYSSKMSKDNVVTLKDFISICNEE